VPIGAAARALADRPLNDIVKDAIATAGTRSSSHSSSDGTSPMHDPLFPGGTVELRKHVLVSLGSAGVLWLSAPPAIDNATADLLAGREHGSMVAGDPEQHLPYVVCRLVSSPVQFSLSLLLRGTPPLASTSSCAHHPCSPAPSSSARGQGTP
jgi:hypothetical protein